MISLVRLMNGKFKTVKLYDFNRLIDHLNHKFPDLSIKTLDLNRSPIDSNAWLSGFIDADGYFGVRLNSDRVSCSFELVQAVVDKKNNDKREIMESLANFLNIKLNIASKAYCNGKNQYVIKSSNINSNLILFPFALIPLDVFLP